MNNQELRDYCKPLMMLNTINDCQAMLDKFARFFFIVISKYHYNDIKTQADADLKIIFQTLFSKIIYIKNLLNGIDYYCYGYDNENMGNGTTKGTSYSMNHIIDPTILATIVRTVFETICTFEIIYIIPDTEEKKKIIYYLFQNEGLKYQSRFYEGQTDENILRIKDEEQGQIDKNIALIKNTQTYKELTSTNKLKLDKIIDGKSFRVTIKDGEVTTYIPWKDILILFHLNHQIFDDIYTHFSLYAHPSYISIRNYHDMFNIDKPRFLDFAKLEIKFCITLLSIFLGDYFKVFPKIKEIYFSIPIEDQILLNYHNKLIRGYIHSFSDAWKQLED